jgi:hypothetical protein
MAAATMYVTVAGGDPTHDGTTWAKAFSMADFLADLTNNAEAGDIYYVQAGTYTLTGAHDSSAKVGTAVAPISIIGVKAATSAEPPVLADWGTWVVGHATDDCPKFVCGANTFKVGNYHKTFNCNFTTDEAKGYECGTYCITYNCASTNSSGTANRYAFYNGTGSSYVKCEAVSTAGYGLYIASGRAVFCYIHDSTNGINSAGQGDVVLFSVTDTCSGYGIAIGGSDYNVMMNNTFYNCATAFSATTGDSNLLINNIIDTATDGFKWTTTTNNNFFAYNHEGNNVTEMFDTATAAYTLFHGDQWATTPADPKFTNAAGGDLSLGSDSPCIDAGMTITLGVG